MRPLVSVVGLLLVSATPAWVSAQERPFAFAFSPAAWARDGALVFATPAYTDAAPSGLGRDGFENQLGLEARVARRLSLLGDVSVGDASARGSVTQFRAEALFSVLGGGRPFQLAAGSGYRRELDGTSVWLGRMVAERGFESGRVLADVRLEKAFAKGRDGVDVIVTLAATRALGRGFSGGAEMVGEDIEALFEKDEAEGGGRILLGPSLHWRRGDGRLLANAAGGPVLLVNANGRLSTAPRTLGSGFAIRASLAYVF
jgi:hypothetical protein